MLSSLSCEFSSNLLKKNEALRDFVDCFPLSSFIEKLDEVDPFLGYRYFPVELLELQFDARGGVSQGTFSDYLYLVVAQLIEGFEHRFEIAGLSDLFRFEFERSFKRILLRAKSDKVRALASFGNDVFLKDLGIARLILIPCASHVVYRHAGIPRRVLLNGRGAGWVELVKTLVFDTRSFRPYLENHVHLAMLDDFNPEGRERCLRLVAELLRCWPESHGLIGSSWYYDPAVGRVSPHLAYLHDVPAGRGACFVDMGESEDALAGALARSPSRRLLAETGAYSPHNFMMIWSRRKILEHYGC